MKKVAIVAAVLLALLAAAVIMNATVQKKDSPQVRIMEDTDNDEIILSQSAKIDGLEKKMAQQEFDYAAIKAERDALERKSRALEEQVQYLVGRNRALDSSRNRLRNDIADLDKEIAALNEKLAQLSKEREENDAAYQAQLAEARADLEAAKNTNHEISEESKVPSSFRQNPLGQSRNIIGIKGGETDIDIEGTFALMPHWFLVADLGIIEAPDDLVEKDFPGLKADHSYMYTILFGTGLNWRMNSLQSQPNFYISTMIGPSWFRYVDDYNDEEGINTYLLWRSSVGFDMTLYKNLQFTTEISVDWIKDFEITPRVTMGLQWSFSNSWSALREK